jgi:hypothetical protein
MSNASPSQPEISAVDTLGIEGPTSPSEGADEAAPRPVTPEDKPFSMPLPESSRPSLMAATFPLAIANLSYPSKEHCKKLFNKH